MKKLLSFLFILVGLTTYGQTTINPDTVCVNSVGEQYFVTNTVGSTYQWSINGGTLQTGQGTNSPVLLDVFILNLTANNIGPFCPGDPTTPLVGNPAGGTWSGTGVVANSFQPSTGVGNYVLTYTMAGCSTTINVVVNSGPVTGPIQHY